MLVIQLLRYLFGYVKFRAFGGFADRFINLCTKHEIPLWNVKHVNGNITANTTIQGYLSIRIPARKSGMRVIHTEKVGLRFFLKKHKSRVGIFIGILIFSVIIFILSQFVWSVSVVGNNTIDEEIIVSAFENYGVKVGVPVSSIDNDEAVQNVMSEIEKLSWASVNIKGSVVVIEVREKTEAPVMYDASKPTNVVAGEDGVILSVDVLYGNEEIKPGSAVTKGDLLISGVITHKDGSEKVIHADGYVKAIVEKQKSFANDIAIRKIESERKRNVIFFFGLRIPLGASIETSFFTEHKSFIENEKNLVPVGIITQYGADFSKEQIEVSDAMQDKIALFSNALYVRELLEYSNIRVSKIEKVENSKSVQYDFSVKCEQEIGVLQEIYVEKTNDIQ